MLSAVLFVAAAVVMIFTPGTVLGSFGAEEAFEVELLRWAGLFLLLQAGLVARMARKRIVDERWGRVIAAGDLTLVLAALFFTTGNPFFLLLGFAALVGIALRTLMPVLDSWSEEVRARWTREGGGAT